MVFIYLGAWGYRGFALVRVGVVVLREAVLGVYLCCGGVGFLDTVLRGRGFLWFCSG